MYLCNWYSAFSGVAYLYFIFAGFTVLAIAFIHIFVPESKVGNKTFFKSEEFINGIYLLSIGMSPGDIQQDETVHEKLIT